MCLHSNVLYHCISLENLFLNQNRTEGCFWRSTWAFSVSKFFGWPSWNAQLWHPGSLSFKFQKYWTSFSQCCHSVHKDGPKSILWTILTKMVHIWSIFSKFSPSFSFFMKTMTKVHILAKNSRKAVDINSPFFCMKRTIKVHLFAKNNTWAFYSKIGPSFDDCLVHF